ncbi:hypothetical protein E2C01_001873 [Portunus trituberculatus]|uniref:Uncharacterized protein n=1 Tax=Portunus trituberculatus TaxID=210409 RepID=A0A5B7CID1_PORTR|nr:hypothetical protein [Portunus trituberculatus]
MTDSSENQVKATEEVIDNSKICPSQPQDASVEDNTTNITTRNIEQQAQSVIHEEHKPVEEITNGSARKSTETDSESKTDLVKSTLGEDTNPSEQLEQRSTDARELKEEKEQLLTIQKPNDVDSIELPKTETKETKKKLSGNNFPKSIKNFAGSVFSQQFGGKAKTEVKGNESSDKKKKKGRLNPFSKENLFKSPVKEKSDSVKEMPQKDKETKDGDKTEGEKLASKNNHNPFEDDKENLPCDKVSSPPEDNNDSVEAKRDTAVIAEDSTPCATTSNVPDVLHSNGISSAGRTSRSSSISLEFVSQVDSDEMKTVSHESSPEMDFVEEDGLRLRKDALLAIKAMDIDPDDTNTQFYSFVSAVEDFQSPKKEEDLQPIASTKTLPELTATPKVQEAETNEIKCKKEKTTINMQEEAPQKLYESSTHEEERTSEKNHAESPQKLSESPTHKEETTSEKKHESPKQLSESSSNVRSSEEIAIKTDVEEEYLQRKVIELNKKNNEEVTSKDLINGLSTNVPHTLSKQESPPGCIQTATQLPEEIPKLKLDPATPSKGEEAPRPSPRTKKGRYGYSTVGRRSTTPSNRDPSVSDYSENDANESSAKSADSSLTAPYPRRNTSPEKVTSRKAGVKRTPSDSGYAGPASNSYGGSDVEPIYWEISESSEAPPKPSPRTKKSHRTASDATPKSNEAASSQSQTAVPEESPKKPLPEWINTRAPIPSPRGKKQRSLQSLPNVVPDDNNMEAMKKKLQMLSHEPLPDVAIPQSQPIVTKREEDQFYSGKAASISYGFTPSRAAPPSPPSRVRKASQISLPAAMAAEEAQCRQQKRRSLYVSPDGDIAPEPPSPRRARRRTDPTQGTTLRNIQSAVKVSPNSLFTR